MNRASCPVLVFAKAPVPGQVKTRLIPAVGAGGAATLHEWLCRRALTAATAAAVGPVELWCAPPADHGFFRQCAKEFRVSLREQRGDDLGQRLAHAFSETLKTAPYALVIGTDCPGLGTADLRQAATALGRYADAVVSPAQDGGYVLLGLRRFAPEVFQGVSWGSDRVLDETRARLHGLGWHWTELPEHWDVDRPADLTRLGRMPVAEGLSR